MKNTFKLYIIKLVNHNTKINMSILKIFNFISIFGLFYTAFFLIKMTF